MQSAGPHYRTGDPGHVAVLESPRSPEREAALERWLAEAEDAGARTWRLRCAPEVGGIWAGLAELIGSLSTEIEEVAPDLLRDHAYEVSLVLPDRGRSLQVHWSLTDLAAPREQTRNYAADRAYRSLHGLIDLLAEWHSLAGDRPWAIACEDYEQANRLVWRFFRELVRRRSEVLGVQLLLAVEPGRADEVAQDFAPGVARRYRVEGTPVPPVEPDAGRMTELALALESEMRDDEALRYVDVPRLVHYWRHSTRPEMVLPCQVSAMLSLNHRGLYEASLPMADDVETYLENGPEGPDDSERYARAVYAFYFCLVPLGLVDRACRVTEAALADVPAETRASVYYLVAMLYVRFLEKPDLVAAEGYLQRALDLTATVDIPEHEREFQTVFYMNGLALVRVRQRRPEEALALCQAGLERLEARLDPTEHRLHRSVLLYNIAQVYAQVGPYDRALEAFTRTMEMDPNYSEYYNERGAVYFKLGRTEEAEANYLKAIALSPPYADVWVNLGQCYRATERMQDALRAYCRALDLDPTSGLAWAGRADANAALGDADAALEDYTQALKIDDSDATVWAARAVLLFERGRIREAVRDLDRAVERAPDCGELYQNRAVAYEALDLLAEAASDLQTYLDLCPDAEDRAEVSDQLRSLAAS